MSLSVLTLKFSCEHDKSFPEDHVLQLVLYKKMLPRGNEIEIEQENEEKKGLIYFIDVTDLEIRTFIMTYKCLRSRKDHQVV